MYNASLYRKHPQLYRERIQAAPPWRYYATVAGLLMTMAGLCVECSGAALAGTNIWSILTARFMLERLSGTSHAPAHLMEMLVTSALIPTVCVFWRLLGAIRYRAAFL